MLKNSQGSPSELRAVCNQFIQPPARSFNSKVKQWLRTTSHLEYDPNLTSISGHAGSAWFGKLSNGGWSYIAWFSWQSPGFELNDLGFLRYADDMTEMAWAQYNFPKPFSIFRRFNIEASQASSFAVSYTHLTLPTNREV